MKLTLHNSTRTAEVYALDADLGQYRWYEVSKRNKTYAMARIDGRRQYLHRVVMARKEKLVGGKVVDHHPDDYGLNCRRTNLRQATKSQNMANCKAHKDRAGKYKGVWLDKKTGRYVAQICFKGKHIKIGRYPTARAAADAYNKTAKLLFGEFAKIAI